MPWKRTNPSAERERLVLEAGEWTGTFTSLCDRFGISRKTGYKWLGRAADDEDNFDDQSRRPHGNSNAVDPATATRLIQLRRQHRNWGARKLIAWLEDNEPDKWMLPVASTVTEVLKRAGLVTPRRRRKRLPPRSAPLSHAKAPNDLWCMDFKGDFFVDGKHCYPFTLTDAHTRMLLSLRALNRPDEAGVRACLERAFRTFGLPKALRSDNGTPFGARKVAPLSHLSAWLIKVGVLPEYTDLASPHQNPRHERMHLTLQLETPTEPAPSWEAQQRRFDRFKQLYNEERPHEALGQRPPARLYRPSPRTFPSSVKDPTYPRGFETRRISHKGELTFRGATVFLSEGLHHELVGLRPTRRRGAWNIYFAHLVVAQLVELTTNDGRKLVVMPQSPV